MTSLSSALNAVYLATFCPQHIQFNTGHSLSRKIAKYKAVSPSTAKSLYNETDVGKEYVAYSYMQNVVGQDLHDRLGSRASELTKEKLKRFCTGIDFEKVLLDFEEKVNVELSGSNYKIVVARDTTSVHQSFRLVHLVEDGKYLFRLEPDVFDPNSFRLLYPTRETSIWEYSIDPQKAYEAKIKMKEITTLLSSNFDLTS